MSAILDKSNPITAGEEPAVDAAVASSLADILGSSLSEDSTDWTEPTGEIAAAIRGADQSAALGILVHALYRWHEIRRSGG